jgi:hypothetical protein
MFIAVFTMTTKSTQSIFFSTRLKLGRSCDENEEQTPGTVKLSASCRDDGSSARGSMSSRDVAA